VLILTLKAIYFQLLMTPRGTEEQRDGTPVIILKERLFSIISLVLIWKEDIAQKNFGVKNMNIFKVDILIFSFL